MQTNPRWLGSTSSRLAGRRNAGPANRCWRSSADATSAQGSISIAGPASSSDSFRGIALQPARSIVVGPRFPTKTDGEFFSSGRGDADDC